MIVYHGSIEKVSHPEIRQTEIGRDFGFAFYTTDIEKQARRWAQRKAKIANRNSRQVCKAVVNKYEWDEQRAAEILNIKQFMGPSEEWLDMVLQCRSNVSYSHEFDVVIGNIANDNVGETVAYVMQGIMRKEDAIERLKFEKINNQLAFCTPKAIKLLRFIGADEWEV